jgi:dTDP-4-dehydrorhamnose 3,5-epimerase
MHPDERGVFTEVFRDEWNIAARPVQWNVVSSAAGVLRGVHVHPRHDDYFVLVSGSATIGLADLRDGSPTKGVAAVVEQRGDNLSALVIPHGVAHGVLYHAPSTHLYSVSHEWHTDDEVAMRWDDPDLGIPWPAVPTLLSQRDAEAPALADVLRGLAPRQPI